MRASMVAGLGFGLAACAGAAAATPYVDYAIQKGAWHVITIKVDANRIDDYVTSLKKTWGTVEEINKRHGLIDSYQIMVKLNPEGGDANVLLIEHLPNMSALEPDLARDLQMLKELRATQSTADRSQALADFDKYRTFVSDDYWKELVYTK